MIIRSPSFNRYSVAWTIAENCPPDQIENFHIFVPVRRKNKSGRILQLKTDVQQIGFVYCFVKAGFHKYLQDVIEIYVNYNQKR